MYISMQKEAIYMVSGFRLCTNTGIRTASNKNFYLRSTFHKMCAFAVSTKKYLRLYGFSGTNFTAAVNCTDPNTKTDSKIIEIEIIKEQI